ncbi:hypothetical protein ACFYO0_14450 [Streptomyces sp. NPDC006365]|uniref:hypothetical protein n=1 Tax=Streptomyces sp. NPDC006365 TaxID=3364744 RepID=UPI0036BDDD97
MPANTRPGEDRLMTPYERLMAEQIPTGTFGHALPPDQSSSRPTRPWTPDEQAQHVAELLEALDGWHHGDAPRHLRLITDQPDQTAA